MLTTIDWVKITIGNDGRMFNQVEPVGILPYETVGYFNKSIWGIKYIQFPLAPVANAPNVPPTWNSLEFGYSDNVEKGYGELNYIRTKTGSQISYQYLLDNTGIYHLSTQYAKDIVENKIIQKTITHDGLSDLLWSYQYNTDSTTITSPDGGQTIYKKYPKDLYTWNSELVYEIDEPLGSKLVRTWVRNMPYGTRNVTSIVNGPFGMLSNNPYISQETRTVGGTTPKSAVTEMIYDKNGNLREKTEHDWAASGGAIVQKTKNDYYNSTVPDATVITDDTSTYWRRSFPRIDAIQRRTIENSSGAKIAATEFTYDDAYSKGNVTFEMQWDNYKNGTLPPTPGSLNIYNSRVAKYEFC